MKAYGIKRNCNSFEDYHTDGFAKAKKAWKKVAHREARRIARRQAVE